MTVASSSKSGLGLPGISSNSSLWLALGATVAGSPIGWRQLQVVVTPMIFTAELEALRIGMASDVGSPEVTSPRSSVEPPTNSRWPLA